MHNIEDLTGKKFGRLLVLERAQNRNGAVYWKCQCDCGTIKEIRGCHLRSGGTKSCGCLSRELASKRMTTHGERKTRLYEIWYNMRQRCTNPNLKCYKNYGGKGITLCEEWKDYQNFSNWAKLNGYTEELTLDRIDSNKNYCPENCRWVSQLIQQNNRTNNHYITYNNKTQSMADWAREMNLTPSALQHRLSRNWTIEEALTIPMYGRRIKESG